MRLLINCPPRPFSDACLARPTASLSHTTDLQHQTAPSNSTRTRTRTRTRRPSFDHYPARRAETYDARTVIATNRLTHIDIELCHISVTTRVARRT
jgi:hypothetical protein